MAVILKNGSVFLHIPKTGGTWVTSVLRESGLARCSIGHRHANWPHLLAPGFQGVGRKLEYLYKRSCFLRVSPRPFTFCFVRHPLSWYESFYRYKAQPELNWELDGDAGDWNRWHPNAVLNGLGEGRDFNEFVEGALERFPGYVSALYSHYTMQTVDFVGKQENLTEDLQTVLSEMGCKFDPETIRKRERINKSESPKAAVDWDPDLKERVREVEFAAIRRFGYEE